MNKIDKDDLIEDVLKIYEELGYLTKDIYIANGKYSRKPIDRHFGSWNNMLIELKLPINCLINISEEDLLNELKRLYFEHKTICVDIIRHYGKYSIEVYWRRFGSYNNAIAKAGLPTNLVGQSTIAEYVINKIASILGEIPEFEKQFDWLIHIRKLSCDAYFPDHNLVVEYNGKQHYENVPYFGKINSYDSLDKIQQRDQTKYQLLKEHNIKLLIIKYDEPTSIEYLESKLKEIL